MNLILSYFLELFLVSMTFWLLYYFIRKHTLPTFRRFYLLAWMVCSVIFPFISIPSSHAPEVNVSSFVDPSFFEESYQANTPRVKNQVEDNTTTAPESFSNRSESREESLNLEKVILYLSLLYISVALLFIIRILLGIQQIFKLKKAATLASEGFMAYHVVHDATFKGASFFRWIFIGECMKEEKEIIIKHELIHSKRLHSLDKLLCGIYCAIFWINPLSWILRRYIDINAELEVDTLLSKTEEKRDYANTLISLTQPANPILMNHFSAHHLKTRISALANPVKQKKYALVISAVLVSCLFLLISCEKGPSTEIRLVERMKDVKKITTRFTSHQADTQQKTGKIVSIASFLPDGTLDEFVEQTTYPYDRDYEIKRSFWELPNKNQLTHIMDGLSLGKAERNFLYGHDWPSAYALHLTNKNKTGDFWREVVEIDNVELPNSILEEREPVNEDSFIDFSFPAITTYFEYEDNKVMRIFLKTEYPEIEDQTEVKRKLRLIVDENLSEDQKKSRDELRQNHNRKLLSVSYEYNDRLLTKISHRDYERRFFYQNDLLIRSEYYKSDELLNTRIHHYDDGLKDRTEILNRYNEPEYTIHYEYEFWE